MKSLLLRLLLAGDYVSGEAISEQLHVSRTAVWKQINALKEQGYMIQSTTNKGYKLLQAPDTVKAHDIEARVQTKTFGKEVIAYESVSSTQPKAHQAATNGSQEGTLIVANEQTEGRGRLGREWVVEKGQSISMSLILRPTIPLTRAPQLTLVAAVAVARAIEKVAPLECEIKWPNDLMVNGKKLVGILTEMAADPDQLHYVIVGMGINCHQGNNDFHHEVKDVATSIYAESKQKINRSTLIAEVMNEFEWLYESYVDDGFQAIKTLWEARAISLQQRVIARTPKGTISGFACGITDEGQLRLREENGQEHLIYSADIELDTTS
ncbi:biotin--[acetyl-CoA-carboxylase] ligase [Shouchella lehensis]|uniref:Bifunctional ligase/repressor BirA n=1 Tax=Shouchella lehensis G1 TaxID=1246626 RepID=A0A060LXU3_9BACI|nr:biotin--[acetyl-CoA-carboxylase] ligase [Shouchella lehensis]AIC94580.1 biotin--protein ligase domain-containing protein [Shouchella lehensis G1]